MVEVLKTVYKASGWWFRLQSIGSFILGIIIIIAGIVVTIVTGVIQSLLISVVGLLFILVGWFNWWRSKRLIQGKFG
jgi:hypothetical protein